MGFFGKLKTKYKEKKLERQVRSADKDLEKRERKQEKALAKDRDKAFEAAARRAEKAEVARFDLEDEELPVQRNVKLAMARVLHQLLEEREHVMSMRRLERINTDATSVRTDARSGLKKFGDKLRGRNR